MDNITQGQYKSKYLDEEHPIIIRVPIAAALKSDRQAYFLQQVKYWINTNKSKPKNQQYFNDGRWWMYNTLQEWQEQFPWLSKMTIRRIIEALKDKGILLTGNYNKKRYDKTVWYSIDEQKLDEIIESYTSQCSKRTQASVQNEHMDLFKMNTPIPEINTEIKQREQEPEKPPALPLNDQENEKPKSAIKELVGYYINLYHEKNGDKPAISKGKDHSIIKSLVSEYGADKVRLIIDEHVKRPDGWTRERGCSISTIKHNLPAYLERLKKAQAETEKEQRQRAAMDALNRRDEERERQRQKEQAEWEALPELEKAQRKLSEYIESRKPLREIHQERANQGDQQSINKLKEYDRKEEELRQAIEDAKSQKLAYAVGV